MKILLTAFDPFGQEKINPALEAMKQVDVSRIAADIVKLEVPTVFGRAIDVVTAAMDREKPDAVLAIGQAGGRWALTPERVAINIDDAGIADNEGRQPADEAVVAGGPAAYFSTLPVKKMVQAIREAGLPAEVSNSAGTFVCNHLLYGMLHHIDRNYPGQMRAGFLHVPYIPEQVLNKPGKPSMSLPDIVRGIEAALEAIVVRPGP